MPDPFISRDDLADATGRSEVTTDDYALACVDAACDMVRTLAEQTFNEVTGDTITLDGTGTDAIVLPELPVNAAGTVELIDNEGGTTTLTDYVVNGHGVLLRNRGTAVEDFPTGYFWPEGRQNVQVTYDHGYGTADMPRDVRMVALAAAQRMFLQGPALFETLGQQSVRYGVNSTDFTDGERAILRKYRQVG